MRTFVMLVVALATASMAAQPRGAPAPAPAAPEPERPWARGVPEAKRTRALELFRDGNAALKESLFVKAAQTYREALTYWDHPAIHYNLALALVNLDQPVETHEHLLAALKYGASPLDSDKFEQAQRYKSLVEKQLTTIEVSCELAGAAVRLDGRPLFTAPGKWSGVVRSGPHTLIATRDGYLPNEQSVTLAGGERRSFDLKLLSAEELTEYRRKWAVWVPWTVVAAGAVLAGTGVALHLGARDSFEQFDKAIAGCVRPDTGGCVPSVGIAGMKQRGEALQGVAITSYFLAGAALTTGAVLVYMNRLQPYQRSLGVTPQVTIAPILGPGGGGATLVVGF